jgi:hypothetical protein
VKKLKKKVITKKSIQKSPDFRLTILLLLLCALGITFQYIPYRGRAFGAQKQRTIEQIIADYHTTYYPTDNFQISTDNDGYEVVKDYIAENDMFVIAKANYVLNLNANGRTGVTQAVTDKKVAEIAALLTKNGFTYDQHPAVTLKLPGGPVVMNDYYAHAKTGFYHSPEVTCILGGYGEHISGPYLHIEAAIKLICANYSSLKNIALEAKPFSKAFDESYAQNSNLTKFRKAYGMPNITGGATIGYNTAEVLTDTASLNTGGGATSYFYTDNIGKNWYYLTTSQQGFSCNALTTNDQKAAYGTNCTSPGMGL